MVLLIVILIPRHCKVLKNTMVLPSCAKYANKRWCTHHVLLLSASQ